MISGVKRAIKVRKDRFLMFGEFYQDYKNYKMWNYNNPKIKTRASQESKILRQTHMIEKGMSLSNPRRGFGQAKIADLFKLMDAYLDLGYPSEGMPFQNAICVLKSYVEMQREMNYENSELISKLASYEKYCLPGLMAGIEHENKSHLMEKAKLHYPEFFLSRHSMRQFSDKIVNPADIKKAVQIAQKAPTACNRQAAKVYMYLNEKVNEELSDLIAGNTGFDKDVKNYLVITADVSAFYDTFERNQIYVEAGLFTMALVEALHYYGIGSCVLQEEQKN